MNIFPVLPSSVCNPNANYFLPTSPDFIYDYATKLRPEPTELLRKKQHSCKEALVMMFTEGKDCILMKQLKLIQFLCKYNHMESVQRNSFAKQEEAAHFKHILSILSSIL